MIFQGSIRNVQNYESGCVFKIHICFLFFFLFFFFKIQSGDQGGN